MKFKNERPQFFLPGMEWESLSHSARHANWNIFSNRVYRLPPPLGGHSWKPINSLVALDSIELSSRERHDYERENDHALTTIAQDRDTKNSSEETI